MKVKTLAIPMAFIFTMSTSPSFALDIRSVLNKPMDCRAYETIGDDMHSLALMPRSSQTQATKPYQNALQFYKQLYSEVLYANFLRDSNGFLKLQRDFSYCANGKLIGETLSWEQLSQKLGPAKSEELKKQLAELPGVVHAEDIAITSSFTTVGGIVVLLLAGGTSAVGAPAAVAGIIIGVGLVGATGSAAWVAGSRLPTFIRKIALRYDSTDRQVLDQEALRMATYQVNNVVGSALTRNNTTVP
jgi:hypothetical protein